MLKAWQALDEFLHFALKSHLETFVKLVNDQIADTEARDVLLVQMVVQTTWRTKDNVRLDFTQHFVLVHSGTSAIAGGRAHTTAHTLQDVV